MLMHCTHFYCCEIMSKAFKLNCQRRLGSDDEIDLVENSADEPVTDQK